MGEKSIEPQGLKVVVERVLYHRDNNLPPDRPHAFIYFLHVHNASDRTVTLLGRKWIIRNEDGSTHVIEGDKIVGETPTLAPGETFSYNSYHMTHQNGQAHGCIHGVDSDGHRIHVRIPPFPLTIPSQTL